jgi:hypothetical protein
LRVRRFRLRARPPHKIRGAAQDKLPLDARYASCTKLISASICYLCGLDVCNIRTTTGSRTRRFPKPMEAQGFVSNNDRLEKTDQKTTAGVLKTVT